jgi:hypothetical protein
MKKLLFLFGTARSGTSALVNVLNTHPGILMGQERYFFTIRQEKIARSHFEKQRFLDVRETDTHNRSSFKGKNLDQRYDNATYIGDKYPSLFRHMDIIFERFPDAHYLYIVRNPLSVVESFDARHRNPNDHWKHSAQDGIDAWNESVGKVSSLSDEQLKKFVLVQYETLYQSTENMNQMFVQLGLDPVDDALLQPFVSKFLSLNETAVPRRDDLRMQVAQQCDWDSYLRLCLQLNSIQE